MSIVRSQRIELRLWLVRGRRFLCLCPWFDEHSIATIRSVDEIASRCVAARKTDGVAGPGRRFAHGKVCTNHLRATAEQLLSASRVIVTALIGVVIRARPHKVSLLDQGVDLGRLTIVLFYESGLRLTRAPIHRQHPTLHHRMICTTGWRCSAVV